MVIITTAVYRSLWKFQSKMRARGVSGGFGVTRRPPGSQGCFRESRWRIRESQRILGGLRGASSIPDGFSGVYALKFAWSLERYADFF